MKKWLPFLVVLLTLAGVIFYKNHHADTLVQAERKEYPAPALVVKNVPLAPASTSSSSLTPTSAPRLPSSGSPQSLRERMDPQVPIQVGTRNYLLHERFVAMEKAQAQVLGLRIQKTLGGWALVDVSEAPLNSYPVLAREGSEELGVFRGVMKSLSREVLTENGAWKNCPVTVLSAYPEIKVYLLQLSGASSPEDLRVCLEESRLFSRLEWEVLDQPRVSR